jgi:diguanylate cyclase
MKSHLRLEIERLRKENLRLKRRLLVDDLTGLYNAKCLKQRLRRCLGVRKSRENEGAALLFIDVDYFKEINLAHGHLAASRILNQVGQVIARVIRADDLGFRYGGDEFVVLVKGGDELAKVMGERIRSAIAEQVFCEQGLGGIAQVRLTVSVGVRVIRENDTAKEVLEAADRAMYEAKRLSRNTVVAA